MLLHNEAKAILCFHIDRFSRDLAGFFQELGRYSKEDIQLWVVGRGQIKAGTSSEFLLTGMEGVVAQYQRMLGGEKTKLALKTLKNKGRRYSGQPPYGYRHVEGDLIENMDEQTTLDLIKGRKDWPARRLQRWLNSSGLMAREGKDWQASTIWHLQRRMDA